MSFISDRKQAVVVLNEALGNEAWAGLNGN